MLPAPSRSALPARFRSSRLPLRRATGALSRGGDAQCGGDGLHRERALVIPSTPTSRGVPLPGTGEQPTAPVFIDGKKAATLRGATLSADFKQMVIDDIERRWGQGARAAEFRKSG